jgi:hypothetical protein
MMGDLISREAVLGVIRMTGVASAQEKLRIIAAVRDVPTVEAVEVVRCKDCKYRCNGKDCDHPLLLSWSWGAIRNVKDDDFCSYGEEKTE